MRITENPRAAQTLASFAFQKSQTLRAPGVHVSDLVGCLRAYHYKQTLPREYSDEDKLTLLLGQSQHVLLQPVEGSEIHILLAFPEGTVYGTVDVYMPEVTELFRHPTEIKTTRSNDLKEPVYGMPHYIEQLASYCLGLKTTHGSLVVWYIWAMPAQLRWWDFEFTDQELEGWRTELGRRLTTIKDSGTMPSVDEHRRGECRTCPYYKKNDGPCEGGEGRPASFFFPDDYTALGG